MASSVIGAATGAAVSEKLKTPKDIVMFYVGVANSCYKATGSKRVACVVAAGTCGFALVPGPHQPLYIIACAACLNGINKM